MWLHDAPRFTRLLAVTLLGTRDAELKKMRREAGAPDSLTLAAFGDPTYPALSRKEVDRLSNPEVRAAVRDGYALEPLPASRKEVEGIARLYGGRAATYLGDQATEERAKAIGQGARICTSPAMACSTSAFR
jgi:hypothetical protein